MHRKLLVRRPSAAMVVAVIALFVALGGVGWAQFSVPRGSVGTAQLRNGAVTNSKLSDGSVGNFKLKFNSVGSRKLINNAVGITQINADQVQARVVGSCQGAGAIATIATTGNVTCTTTPPAEFGAANASGVTLASGATATTVLTKALPGGSPYVVLAAPNVLINNAGNPPERVEVDCTLTVAPGNGASLTRSVIRDLPDESANKTVTTPQAADSIPLVVPAPAVAAGSTATVSCTEVFGSAGVIGQATPTTAAKVTVSSNINAIQTANNN